MSKHNKGSKSSERPAALRDYRFLAIIYGIALLLAAREVSDSNLPAGPEHVNPEWVLNPDHNLADVYADLYPDRSESHYWRGFQAGMCWDRHYKVSPVCDQFQYRDLNDVRESFERGIETGVTSGESLLYEYAFILLQLGEDEQKVEQAIQTWRFNHPGSKRPDPRIVFFRRRISSPRNRQ